MTHRPPPPTLTLTAGTPAELAELVAALLALRPGPVRAQPRTLTTTGEARSEWAPVVPMRRTA